MGLSATALAAVDPSCDGDPYNNDPAIHDFAIDTPDSHVEHAVSAVEGAGLACGSDTTNTNTFYDTANVLTPPGVEVNGTSGIANTRFVGTAVVDVASNLFGLVQNQVSVMRIEPVSSCLNETVVGGHIPGTTTACYKGANAVGYNYNWTTVDDNSGRSSLTIGPFHPILGIAGLTHIKQFNLCGNVGSTSGSQYPADCGDSSQPFLQKNGDRSVPNCNNGNGVYSVTATNRGGATTAPATACVEWTAPPTPTCLEPLPAPNPWTVLGQSTAKPETACARSRGGDPRD